MSIFCSPNEIIALGVEPTQKESGGFSWKQIIKIYSRVLGFTDCKLS